MSTGAAGRVAEGHPCIPRVALWGGTLLLLALGVGIWRSSTHPSDSAGALPYLVFRSTLRTLVAFFFSLLFGITLGYVAATRPRISRVLLPLLDILQSVPILGFFPAAIALFVLFFGGSTVGLEVASIFLIFTSQVWNLAFAMYEAILSIPKEISEAADSFGLRGWRRFRRLLLPAAIPRLTHNAVVSWAGGWYFLTASEILSVGGSSHELAGVGSFLFRSAERGDLEGIAWGLLALTLVIVAFEVFVWNPLSNHSRRYVFEGVGPSLEPTDRILTLYRRAFQEIRKSFPQVPTFRIPPIQIPRVLLQGIKGALLAMGFFLGLFLSSALVALATRPLPPEAPLIPLALLASTVRLGVAYLLAVAWTLPVAVLVSRSPQASRILVPLAEILASIPAVALFPVIVLVLLRFTGGLEVPSILLVLTGMQWYLLFNLLGGLRQIPQDLVEVARVEGLRGWGVWRRLWIPGSLPSLVTGSLTAVGGGWNALIVSEYVTFGGEVHRVFGIGSLIAHAAYEVEDPYLLGLSVVSLSLYVYALNAFFWHPLYRRVTTRYRMEV